MECGNAEDMKISIRMRALSSASFAATVLLWTTCVSAYVGPGAGAGFVTSLLTTLSVIVLALLAVLAWPIRLLIKRWRRRRADGKPVGKVNEPPQE